MIKGPKCCFLSRPRRFGKTLLIDTFDELFRGNRELFKGLWIDTDSDYAFERHPVLKLNMAYSKISTKKDLEARIECDLREAAEIEDVTITQNSYGEMLGQFLKNVKEKYGIGAVVLIDEYDAPVAMHMSDLNLAADNRDVLYDFYTSLKKYLNHIRFVLVTGITRFTMTALDSGPNNFVDISLLPDFAGICGFTLSEFDVYFSDRLEEILNHVKIGNSIELGAANKEGLKANILELKSKILEWYDGYNWLGPERVYNPYSILNFFLEKDFSDYWPALGVPNHLSALVRESPLEFIQPSLDSCTVREMKKIELGELKPVPVLFHNGYLTIDGQVLKDEIVDGKTFKVKAYSFKIPNLEVRMNYRASLFKQAFDPKNHYFGDFAKKLPKAILEKNSKELIKLLRGILSSITYFQHEPSESYYHSILQAAFIAAGIVVISEVPGALGRSDMAVFLKDMVCVAIELKYRLAGLAKDNDDLAEKDLIAALNDAEIQIREKEYAQALSAISRNVICLALAIRGRTQVAARFIDLSETEITPAS
jgi:hypothetical protein